MGIFEGCGLGVPEKLVCLDMQLSGGSVTLDKVLHREGIVLEEMDSVDVRRIYTPPDPGVDLWERLDK